jgi:hypothetical protein
LDYEALVANFRKQMADYARAQRFIELSEKTWRAWEKGGRIHWKNAQRVAAHFEVDPETLVQRELSDNGNGPHLPDEQDDDLRASVERLEKKLDALIAELRGSPETQ